MILRRRKKEIGSWSSNQQNRTGSLLGELIHLFFCMQLGLQATLPPLYPGSRHLKLICEFFSLSPLCLLSNKSQDFPYYSMLWLWHCMYIWWDLNIILQFSNWKCQIIFKIIFLRLIRLINELLPTLSFKFKS